jgi:hypothetical protein
MRRPAARSRLFTRRRVRILLVALALGGWLFLQLAPLARMPAAPQPLPPRPPAPHAPPSPEPSLRQWLTVATGANGAYFAAMRNLVGSVNFWCPNCTIAVFNLGLSADELAQARGWCHATLHWGDGYAHGDPNTYAFKALALQEAVNTYGAVLWLDGGSTATGPLYPAVMPLLVRDGHFLVQGQDLDMVPWTHPGMLTHFGVSAERFRGGKPSFSGNTVGFLRGAAAERAILAPWVACARNASCINPPGASKANHRYDQAALSVIAYTCGLAVTPHTELLAAERGQLQPCEAASTMVVWTSRGGEQCYARYATERCAPLPGAPGGDAAGKGAGGAAGAARRR